MNERLSTLVELEPQCLRAWINSNPLPAPVRPVDSAPWLVNYLQCAQGYIPSKVLQHPWPEYGPPSVEVIGEWTTPHVGRVVPVCRIKLERDYSDVVFVRDPDHWVISVSARSTDVPQAVQCAKRWSSGVKCRLPPMYMRRRLPLRGRKEPYTACFHRQSDVELFFAQLGEQLGVSRLSDDEALLPMSV